MTWWASLYDDWLVDQLLVRDEAEVSGTLAFLIGRLDLAPGMRVMDQCCGIGSLSLPLAERGFRVVGVDQSSSYIERAKREAQSKGLDLELLAADACRFVPKAPVDAVFNWWTSFGYAESDEENLAMLVRAFESLVRGGRFALDTMNVPGVMRSFQPHVALRRVTPRGEVLLLRESSIDLARGRIDKRWSYFLGGRQQVEHRSSVRLYMPDAIVTMLTNAGFVDVELLGDTQGASLTTDSPRLIALARRPPS